MTYQGLCWGCPRFVYWWMREQVFNEHGMLFCSASCLAEWRSR